MNTPALANPQRNGGAAGRQQIDRPDPRNKGVQVRGSTHHNNRTAASPQGCGLISKIARNANKMTSGFEEGKDQYHPLSNGK